MIALRDNSPAVVSPGIYPMLYALLIFIQFDVSLMLIAPCLL